MELGLTPGTPVTLVRLAPLRDPMEIRVRLDGCAELPAKPGEVDAEATHQHLDRARPEPVLAGMAMAARSGELAGLDPPDIGRGRRGVLDVAAFEARDRRCPEPTRPP